jgi:TBCC domain-containing protein 1
VIENVRRGTVVRRRRDFPASASVRVADCEDAVVYLLAPAAYVSVVGCANCVVVVGAASRAVRVERCRRVTVIAAARRLRVRAAVECVFHLGVAERPVFLGECRGNVLAPYNTFYETLEADLETAGLSVDALSVDAWREPQCAFANLSDESQSLAKDSSPSRGDAERPERPAGGGAVERMSPEAFAPFIVPFRGDTLNDTMDDDTNAGVPIKKTTRANPFAVPDAYVAALDAKVRAVAALRGALRDARLGEEKKRDLQATIQAHFKEWLLESGSMRQVYELARIERGESAL